MDYKSKNEFWSTSLSIENAEDLERTQKSFAKLVLKQEYTDYETALLKLNLQSLIRAKKKITLPKFQQRLHKT